jgi:hypothetical protein
MMKAIAAALCAAGLALVAAPALAETRTYELAEFDSISIATGIEAVVEVGGTQSVSVEIDDPDLFDKLEIDVRGSTLRARIELSFLDNLLSGGVLGAIFADRAGIRMHITVPELTAVEASSGARVRVDAMQGADMRLDASSGAVIAIEEVNAAAVRADASSGAQLSVNKGSCESIDAASSSGAGIDLRGLECGDARARASSGAALRVFAADKIDAEASSGASIRIAGDPDNVRVQSTSDGSIEIE